MSFGQPKTSSEQLCATKTLLVIVSSDELGRDGGLKCGGRWPRTVDIAGESG
jgi:hypothetical protein